MKVATFVVFVSLFLASSSPALDWEFRVVDIYDPELRANTIATLKKEPGIENGVRGLLLDPDFRHLGADLTVSLELRALTPELIVAATADPSGVIFITLFEMDPAGKDPLVARALRKQADTLGTNDQAPAITVVLLDRYAGLTETLTPKKVSALLVHPSHEVRIALARRLVKAEKIQPSVVKELLASNPYQVRMETIASLSGRATLDNESKSLIHRRCAAELRAEVKEVCGVATSQADLRKNLLSGLSWVLGFFAIEARAWDLFDPPSSYQKYLEKKAQDNNAPASQVVGAGFYGGATPKPIPSHFTNKDLLRMYGGLPKGKTKKVEPKKVPDPFRKADAKKIEPKKVELKKIEEKKSAKEPVIGQVSEKKETSASDEKNQLKDYIKIFNDTQVKLAASKYTLAQACLEGNESTRDPFMREVCLKRYAALHDKPTLKFDMFSGYQNFDNHVRDTVERAALAEWLQLPCKGKSRVCGFERDPDDADLFFKTISWAGNSTKRVEIRLHDSSVSTDNAKNEKSDAQKEKTKKTEKQFAKALKESDMVFYQGHSRYGGGPDFGPEKKDHGQYKKDKPGLKLMATALKDRKDPLFMLTLVSCDSKKHFELDVTRSGVVDRMVLSKKSIGPDEGHGTIIRMMEDVMSQTCQPLMPNPNLFVLKTKNSAEAVDYAKIEREQDELFRASLAKEKAFVSAKNKPAPKWQPIVPDYDYTLGPKTETAAPNEKFELPGGYPLDKEYGFDLSVPPPKVVESKNDTVAAPAGQVEQGEDLAPAEEREVIATVETAEKETKAPVASMTEEEIQKRIDKAVREQVAAELARLKKERPKDFEEHFEPMPKAAKRVVAETWPVKERVVSPPTPRQSRIQRMGGISHCKPFMGSMLCYGKRGGLLVP